MRRLIDQYIQQYGRRLYGLCRSLCASPYDADDLYQETWLRVVKHISQYDPSREFESWLTRVLPKYPAADSEESYLIDDRVTNSAHGSAYRIMGEDFYTLLDGLFQ